MAFSQFSAKLLQAEKNAKENGEKFPCVSKRWKKLLLFPTRSFGSTWEWLPDMVDGQISHSGSSITKAIIFVALPYECHTTDSKRRFLTRARYSVIALLAFICQHSNCAVRVPRYSRESTAVEFLQYRGRVFTAPR